MTADENAGVKRETLPTLIAWLSTCLMAAGLGTMIDPRTHNLWVQAGCFGLVAAVGLDVAARMRGRRKRMRQWRDAQRRCERSLAQVVAQRDVAGELRAAVTHLLATCPLTKREQRDTEEARWSCNMQVEVYAVRRDGHSTCPETDKIGVVGKLDNLSISGFGLQLEEQLASRLVIIAFAQPDEQPFDLLGEILWCDPRPDGRMRAGGRMLRVLPLGARREVGWPAGQCADTPRQGYVLKARAGAAGRAASHHPAPF